ncbi:MAG: hypothetical protein AB1556_16480 [Bacillota bacterium]
MNKDQVDHDRLFKELLETFFTEFRQLFFPRRQPGDRLYAPALFAAGTIYIHS